MKKLMNKRNLLKVDEAIAFAIMMITTMQKSTSILCFYVICYFFIRFLLLEGRNQQAER